MHEGHDDDHDRGLAFDLATLFGRRRVLKLVAGAGLLALVGCGSDDDSSSPATTTGSTTAGSGTTATSGASSTTTAGGAAEECAPIPEETAGPFPGDGTNGPDVLAESGVVRSDITRSIGSASGAAEGIPLTVTLTVQDTADGCAPSAGSAVYLWHCDREGRYSMYSEGATDENYLRGVQEADADGKVTFISIFPAAYRGRWPHIHFEVYASVADATSGAQPLATSQLALPEDVCAAVYATDGYEGSTENLASTSLTTDNVFRDDGAAHQMAAVSGSVDAGYAATLTVPV